MSEPVVLAELDVQARWCDLDGATAAAGVIRGADAAAMLGVGRRVAIGPILPCGTCDVCRRGACAVCPHAVALAVPARGPASVPARWLVALDGDLDVPVDLGVRALGPGARAYAMYAEAGLSPREPAIIVGGDVTAAALAQILRAKSAAVVVVASAGSAAERAALAAGLVVVLADVDTAAADLPALAARVAAAAAGGDQGYRPVRLFETSTDPGWRRLALALAGPRTTLVMRTSRAEHELVVPAAALAAELRLVAVREAHPDLAHEVLALVARGELDLA
ncbi:MAG: alcohol dehydrogenase catalytic domain-containing protein [Kofleriaceae bacterium]|nr:alcohol dehydrogenase catalytic domain-containing protein [Kofleriaceae bacterium]